MIRRSGNGQAEVSREKCGTLSTMAGNGNRWEEFLNRLRDQPSVSIRNPQHHGGGSNGKSDAFEDGLFVSHLIGHEDEVCAAVVLITAVHQEKMNGGQSGAGREFPGMDERVGIRVQGNGFHFRKPIRHP